jgi:hypothetical protein
MEALFDVYIKFIGEVSKEKTSKRPSYAQTIQVLELQGTISITVNCSIFVMEVLLCYYQKHDA